MTITQSAKNGAQLLLEAWAYSDLAVASQYDSQCPQFDGNPALIVSGFRALVLRDEDINYGGSYHWGEYWLTTSGWLLDEGYLSCGEATAVDFLAQWLADLN